jgi:TetR/AcrR family transcriptional regulator, cholesterol catabolism regulator
METKERILHKSLELVTKYGIRTVTMDQVAAAVGASKKTIYQYYPDKESLIKEVLEHDLNETKTRCTIDAKAPNAIIEAIQALEFMDKQMHDMNPLVLFELQKYFPKLFQVFLDFKEQFLFNVIKTNLERGIKEGLYRPEVDVAIMAKFRVETSLMIFNTDLYPDKQFDLKHVLHQLFDHFIRGLVTAKGFTIIEKYKSKIQTQYE